MLQPTVSLSPEELELFNEFFSNRFGLQFPEHKREILASRLEPRLRANRLQRYIDYYLLLQYDLKQEIDHLIGCITNNESYFFREIRQFEALEGERLDQLQSGGTQPGHLRFLSAGCSSGEEPYTLNILLRGFAFRSRLEDLHIDAIDLDTERLTMAKSAIYRPSSLRALTEEQTKLYFIKHDAESFELRPSFRQGIHFAPGNILNLATFPRRIIYDAVFCRNVLIYFSESALKAAIDNFAKVLRPGGLLFLGHSESIIGLHPSLQAERIGNCIAYRKKEA